MTWVHFASLGVAPDAVLKFGLRVKTIFSLCFHSLRTNGPFPMNVAGSVHDAPPFVTVSSRAGTPTHSAAIELKYGAWSVSVNAMSLPETLMLLRNAVFAAASFAGSSFFGSMVFQPSQPATMYPVTA